MSKKLETMNFRFEVSEVKEFDRNGVKIGLIKGYAATFDKDRQNDRIVKGAFNKTIEFHRTRKRPIRMQWQHSIYELIGGFDPFKAVEDDRGLYVEGDINLETQRGREAYALAKQGVLTDFSIGFMAPDVEWKDGIREIKEIELYEVSLVSEPANLYANVTEVKSVSVYEDLPLADASHKWEPEAALQRVREFTNSEDEPSQDYKKAFLWFDKENPNDFESYKHLIADVIDGKLTVIPRAVKIAASKYDSSQDHVIAHIEKYYEKMGYQSPFKNGLGKQELDELDLSEIQRRLRKGILKLNGKAAQLFVDGYVVRIKSLTKEVGDGSDAGKSVDDSAEQKVLALLNETIKQLKK